jgi:hypothetical protein
MRWRIACLMLVAPQAFFVKHRTGIREPRRFVLILRDTRNSTMMALAAALAANAGSLAAPGH